MVVIYRNVWVDQLVIGGFCEDRWIYILSLKNERSVYSIVKNRSIFGPSGGRFYNSLMCLRLQRVTASPTPPPCPGLHFMGQIALWEYD